MYKASASARKVSYPEYSTARYTRALTCDWQSLCSQLLAQWDRISKSDLDRLGPDRHAIATLIQGKYGISAPLVENYLANLERTLPINGRLAYLH